MADLDPVIETLEHHWMRAWVARDARTLKALTSRRFRMVVGTRPCVILDAASWLAAAGNRYRCTSYRFGDIYVRRLGSVAVFATQLGIEASIEGEDWSGEIWVTDIWARSGLRRRWRMTERVLSRVEAKPALAGAVRSLQLWR